MSPTARPSRPRVENEPGVCTFLRLPRVLFVTASTARFSRSSPRRRLCRSRRKPLRLRWSAWPTPRRLRLGSLWSWRNSVQSSQVFLRFGESDDAHAKRMFPLLMKLLDVASAKLSTRCGERRFFLEQFRFPTCLTAVGRCGSLIH
jgi:hypothetical protein